MPLALVPLILTALAFVLVTALVASLGVALIGWILASLFPLSVFEGAIIGLVAAVAIAYVGSRVVEGTLFTSALYLDDDVEDEPAPRRKKRRR
jgi:hypothetical protein